MRLTHCALPQNGHRTTPCETTQMRLSGRPATLLAYNLPTTSSTKAWRARSGRHSKACTNNKLTKLGYGRGRPPSPVSLVLQVRFKAPPASKPAAPRRVSLLVSLSLRGRPHNAALPARLCTLPSAAKDAALTVDSGDSAQPHRLVVNPLSQGVAKEGERDQQTEGRLFCFHAVPEEGQRTTASQANRQR